MAQLNITLSQEELLELLAGNREEAFRRLVEKILNQALVAESTEQLKAEKYEREAERTDYRNGSRERALTTKIGTLVLNVPRHRNSPFHTQLFESYSRSEVALLQAMAEMVIMGVSTRKVSSVMELICGKEFSKSTVSEVTKRLDPEIEQFRNRPLNEKSYPFLTVDATYFKVREDHKITSKCLMIAIGHTDDGHCEVLYFNTYSAETNENWLDFFRSLRKNGLADPLMITSDAHPAIRKAILTVYPSSAWQRCQFHFTRNLLDEVPNAHKSSFARSLRGVFESLTLEDAQHKRDQLINDFCDVAEKAVQMLEQGFSDATSIYLLPSRVRRHLRTSNPIERLNRELKRRSDVIGIFPNEKSLLRLMGAVLMEEHDKMSTKKPYYTNVSIKLITPAIKLDIQNVALEQQKSWKTL